MAIAIKFLTILIILSIIGLVSLIVWDICRPNYEKFKEPRSFESEYSLEKKDHHTFLVLRAFDENHVKAAYIDGYGFSIYVVIKGKFFDGTKVKYKNPIIIGRYHHYNDYFPVIAEGNVKENNYHGLLKLQQ